LKDVHRTQVLVEALEQSNVFYFRDEIMLAEIRRDWSNRRPDRHAPKWQSGEMELCIAIEVNTGISIVPEELREIENAWDLAKAIL